MGRGPRGRGGEVSRVEAGASLQGAAAWGGGGDAGRRPFADACGGRRPRREGGELARVEGGVLPDARNEGSGGGPGAGAAVEVPGVDGSSAFGVRSQATQPARDGTKRQGSPGEKIVQGKEEAEEGREASWRAEAKSDAGPDGCGHDGEQREVRLAGGGGGTSPRIGPSETQGLRLRWPGVQLVDLRDAPSARGIHRDLGFRSPAGVPLRRGPCISRLGRGAGLEDVRAMAPLGVGGKSRLAAVEPACRGRGVGGERLGCGGQKANGR